MSALPQLDASLNPRVPEGLPGRTIQLRCPGCSQDLDSLDALDPSSTVTCSGCHFTLSTEGGIWRALAPDRQERFRKFADEYQRVRAAEGRGSSNPEFYLRLPHEDITGRNTWQWKIRGTSFRFFATRTLAQIEADYPQGLDVLDLGAGNCWMSYRLALRGHRPVAVDLIDSAEDGLGAGRHYLSCLRNPLVRFQAEMDRLPFHDRQFDLAIFNASFHYSEDYHRTLGEVLRCVRRPGHVVIIDSPFYERPESGAEMVKERRVEFVRKFGFPSDSLPSREYLTAGILKDLADSFRLSWHRAKPWYGWQWAVRPIKARLSGRREPSKFYILWTVV
jgi:SAM-dependent methyltransferase